MAGELIIPKKEKPFDISKARKDCELPIKLFKVFGYDLDFSKNGTIIFTNDGSNYPWYVSKYNLDTIQISNGKTEFKFSYVKQEDKTYLASLTVTDIFDMCEKEMNDIRNAIGVCNCIFNLNN